VARRWITRDATDFIQGTGIVTGETEQLVIGGTIEGDLGSRGVKLPWASDGITGLVGFEYREDSLAAYLRRHLPDPGRPRPDRYRRRDAADRGQHRCVRNVRRGRAADHPGRYFAKELGLQAGYRYSDYTTNGDDPQTHGATSNSFTPRPGSSVVAGRRSMTCASAPTSPAPSVRRTCSTCSWANTGLTDLTTGENGLFDPCSSGPTPDGQTGLTPTATLEQCARTGVTAAQYGSIEDNPAGQFNIITGGNAQLEPETSDTTTFGVVLTPTFAPGLSVAIDYFQIEVTDAIGSRFRRRPASTAVSPADRAPIPSVH
jgi:iron complex outermembrane receptor protein